jgi:predicted CXXCH cytochrome family protein
VMDPTDATHALKSINCLTCHQPHSGAKPGMLVKDQANDMAFCMTCHSNMMAAPKPQRGPQPGPAKPGQPQSAQPPAQPAPTSQPQTMQLPPPPVQGGVTK